MKAQQAIWERKLVMVTGKGGVGKTTVAAALAEVAQEAGKRVLLAEVTPESTAQSNLLGIYGRPNPKGEERVFLKPRMDGIRISPSFGHRRFLGDALKSNFLASAALRSAALNRFLMAAPSFPEIGMLYQLVSLLREDCFDHLVVDLPATGHALGLVSLPKTVLRVLPKGVIRDALQEGLEVLTDPTRSGVVVVTLPEDMPVTEASELRQGLEDLSIDVCAMMLNRMPISPFSPEEQAALEAYLQDPNEPKLLGSREFHRLLTAQEAQHSFRTKVQPGCLVYEVPASDVDGNKAAIHTIKTVLKRAESDEA